jgi:hypothetical protein
MPIAGERRRGPLPTSCTSPDDTGHRPGPASVRVRGRQPRGVARRGARSRPRTPPARVRHTARAVTPPRRSPDHAENRPVTGKSDVPAEHYCAGGGGAATRGWWWRGRERPFRQLGLYATCAPPSHRADQRPGLRIPRESDLQGRDARQGRRSPVRDRLPSYQIAAVEPVELGRTSIPRRSPNAHRYSSAFTSDRSRCA